MFICIFIVIDIFCLYIYIYIFILVYLLKIRRRAWNISRESGICKPLPKSCILIKVNLFVLILCVRCKTVKFQLMFCGNGFGWNRFSRQHFDRLFLSWNFWFLPGWRWHPANDNSNTSPRMLSAPVGRFFRPKFSPKIQSVHPPKVRSTLGFFSGHKKVDSGLILLYV